MACKQGELPMPCIPNKIRDNFRCACMRPSCRAPGALLRSRVTSLRLVLAFVWAP